MASVSERAVMERYKEEGEHQRRVVYPILGSERRLQEEVRF